jgi:hypothetical protein
MSSCFFDEFTKFGAVFPERVKKTLFGEKLKRRAVNAER